MKLIKKKPLMIALTATMGSLEEWKAENGVLDMMGITNLTLQINSDTMLRKNLEGDMGHVSLNGD